MQIRADHGGWERFLDQVARYEELHARAGVEQRLTRLEQRVAALELIAAV